MSTCADTPSFNLVVKGNDDAELYVIGNDLRTAAYGVGKIRDRLPAGIYKLRAVRGGATKEQLIELAQDGVEVTMFIDTFAAVAPIGPVVGTFSGAIEQLAATAIQAGSICPALGISDTEIGSSRLLVLGHIAAGGDPGDPLRNMRIFPWRRIDARQTLDDEVGGHRIGDEVWRGWARRCAPGPYVIAYHDGVHWIRQMVLVAPDWETRVFVRRSAASDPGGPAAAVEFSIQMAVPGSPVVYQDREQTIEVARRALEAGRPILVSDDLIHNLLHDKWSNPVMGLTGLHLFLEALERRDADPNAGQRRRVDSSGTRIHHGGEIVREVLTNLHQLFGTATSGWIPADLAGLETRAARFLDPAPGPRPVVDHPPMFWASWTALRDAAEETARFDIQPRLWAATAHSSAAGPYFSWQPKRVSLAGYVREAVEMVQAIPNLPRVIGLATTIASQYLDEIHRLGTSETADDDGLEDVADQIDRDQARADVARALNIPASVMKTL